MAPASRCRCPVQVRREHKAVQQQWGGTGLVYHHMTPPAGCAVICSVCGSIRCCKIGARAGPAGPAPARLLARSTARMAREAQHAGKARAVSAHLWPAVCGVRGAHSEPGSGLLTSSIFGRCPSVRVPSSAPDRPHSREASRAARAHEDSVQLLGRVACVSDRQWSCCAGSAGERCSRKFPFASGTGTRPREARGVPPCPGRPRARSWVHRGGVCAAGGCFQGRVQAMRSPFCGDELTASGTHAAAQRACQSAGGTSHNIYRCSHLLTAADMPHCRMRTRCRAEQRGLHELTCISEFSQWGPELLHPQAGTGRCCDRATL